MAKAGWKSRHKKEVSMLLATHQPDEDEHKKTTTSSPPLYKPFPLNRSGGSSAFKPPSTHQHEELRRGYIMPSPERSSTSSECSSSGSTGLPQPLPQPHHISQPLPPDTTSLVDKIQPRRPLHLDFNHSWQTLQTTSAVTSQLPSRQQQLAAASASDEKADLLSRSTRHLPDITIEKVKDEVKDGVDMQNAQSDLSLQRLRIISNSRTPPCPSPSSSINRPSRDIAPHPPPPPSMPIHFFNPSLFGQQPPHMQLPPPPLQQLPLHRPTFAAPFAPLQPHHPSHRRESEDSNLTDNSDPALELVQGGRRRRRQDTLIPSDSLLDYHQVVETSIEEFNEILDSPSFSFSEEDKNKFRDLRRKGKNRQAASKSRTRKLDNTSSLKKERERLKRYSARLKKWVEDKARERQQSQDRCQWKIDAFRKLKRKNPQYFNSRFAQLSSEQQSFLRDVFAQMNERI